MKNVAVVLGNRINDDGTLTKTMYKRLELTLEMDKQFHPVLIIVSGGIANDRVDFSEADAMYDYLVSHGIEKERLLKEGESMSTKQNAIFSYRLLEDVEFDNLIIVSTYGHFKDWNALGYFHDAVMTNEKVSKKEFNLMIYTNAKDYM
jgi:uncharacterized SAM-binding protein YcdF (DUF218 family)